MDKHKLWLIITVFIVASDYPWKSEAYRVFYSNGIPNILAVERESINLECKSDMPMAYCGFIHENGTRYFFSDAMLNAGICSLKLIATSAGAGIWRCHLGRKGTGAEEIKVIRVRIVNEIAAVQRNVTVVHGKSVTLFCTTAKELKPLSYCRFEPPSSIPFSIDSDAKPNKPILDRYYFPKNKSLDRGDCAVTINKVKYEDAGTWTCGAGLEDGKEYFDIITFEVEGLYTMTNASVTGIVLGAISIFVVLSTLGFIAWKQRGILIGRQRQINQPIEHEMQQLEESSPRELGSSLGEPDVPEGSGMIIPRVVVQSPSKASSSSE